MRPGEQELPRQLTPFIGRSAELKDITRLLDDPACRLLTLLGPGGIGKTRLAIEAARQQAGHFPDGLYWVDLQPGQTADFLVMAIAEALSLSLSGQDAPRQQLLRTLQDKTVLLILDNFEQFQDGPDLAGEILQHGPEVRLLVTSRAALHLQEEWLYPLSGLPYPLTNQEPMPWTELETFDAVQLFVERVRQVRPVFSPEDELDGLLRVCRLVEGMPLALELAAGWGRSLDCATIAAEIEGNLGFLTSSLRNMPQRHRSMQAVFAHSWTLLTPAEQAVFPQLAIFRGGFRREAAEAVTGATLSLLTSLVDKSLLRWQANGRYQIHELLRQYAEKRLAQRAADAARSQQHHATYYLDFLHRRSQAILGGQQRQAATEIAADLDNIRTAWYWAAQHHMVEAIGQAIAALAMYWHIKGRYQDAARMLEDALHYLKDISPAEQPTRALLLSEMGWVAIRLGDFDKAEQVFNECQALYRHLDLPPLPGQGTDPLVGLSTLASIQGDYAQAEQLAQQARETAAEQNHLHNLQTANYQLASIAYALGHYEQAQAYAQAAYTVCQQTGDDWFMAYCLNEMGRAAQALGDEAAARHHFEASYQLRESFADPEGMALALHNLGLVALRQQRFDQAQDLFSRSATLYRQINDRGGLAAAHQGLAKTAAAQDKYKTAQEQFRQALAIAAGIQFTSLLLSILRDIGEFLLQTGRLDSGLALLATAQQHPAADQETKTAAQRMLNHMQAALSPALFAAGKPKDLETAVTSAQTELAAPLPSQPQPTLTPLPTTSLVEPLTERELEVLHLLAQGLTNRQIAGQLTVVIGTVKAHNNSIYGKLGVSNRVQAIARARELNLL